MSGAAVDAVRPALVRAARHRLLAHLLTTPSPGWAETARGLAREAEVDPERLPGTTDDEAFREHGSVFAPTGPVSACASDHVLEGFAGKGPVLGDIAAFYRAFGFEPELHEPPDHFSTMLSFVALLALKEAATIHGGDEEETRVSEEAERTFRREHVLPRIGLFRDRLSVVACPDGAYRAVANLLDLALDDGRFALDRDEPDAEHRHG